MSTPVATGRRNLSQRIERFVGALEKEGREPTLYESAKLAQAVLLLGFDRFPEGEDAMMRCEKAYFASAAEIAEATRDAKTLTRAQAREQLARVAEIHAQRPTPWTYEQPI